VTYLFCVIACPTPLLTIQNIYFCRFTVHHIEVYNKVALGNTPQIDVKEHSGFRTINVNGVFGGPRGMYFEVTLYSDEVKAGQALSTFEIVPHKATISRTLECRLIIDPLQAKSIAQWLARHVSEYEKKFGRIPLPDELQNKPEPPESHTSNQKSKAVYQ
jgi:hypothetical protein